MPEPCIAQVIYNSPASFLLPFPFAKTRWQKASRTRNSLAAQVFKYWLPVLVMLGAMYYFSTDVLSGENTASLIEKILRWFSDDPSERLIRGLNYGLRKCMHFFEYAVLAALLFRAFRADSPSRWRWRWPSTRLPLSQSGQSSTSTIKRLRATAQALCATC